MWRAGRRPTLSSSRPDRAPGEERASMAVESWMDLSQSLAEVVARAAASVVRVDGRRRGSSSGVVWAADGTVVTAHHGLEWDDEVAVGLPSGETVAAAV